MSNLILSSGSLPVLSGAGLLLSVILGRAGGRTTYRDLELFTAGIRNPNTRLACYPVLIRFFNWLEECYPGLEIHQVDSIVVAQYVELHPGSAQTRNQHLPDIRSLFRWLVSGGVIIENSAAEGRGVELRVNRDKTPVLSNDEKNTVRQKEPFHQTDSVLDLGLAAKAAKYYSIPISTFCS